MGPGAGPGKIDRQIGNIYRIYGTHYGRAKAVNHQSVMKYFKNWRFAAGVIGVKESPSGMNTGAKTATESRQQIIEADQVATYPDRPLTGKHEHPSRRH